jgi:CheY-like chemotaxis protein
MSHEIRTPMNGILGFADLLKEPHLTEEEQQEYISVIKKSGKRMLNIIDDIVNISKIESGQLEVSISEIDVNQQIEFLWTFFKPESERKGLQLTVKNMLPSKECRIKTDRKKFLAILTNLVNNAIKFTRIGSIEFGVEKKGDFLEFFVKDTGIGVSEHQKEIIFERFRQGSEAHNRTYEGAGLGLSIAKAYVEMLGGKIWLESTPGDGSTFHFTLPNNALREEKTEMKEIFQGIKANDKPKTLKILVADDDEMSRELIVTVFKKPANEILQVQTGIEAVEACRNNPDLDMVLMDIKMPDLDGYEATRQIRQFNKNVIIIAQTAYAMTGDRERAIEAGCNDYISKPITIDVLNGLKQKYFN